MMVRLLAAPTASWIKLDDQVAGKAYDIAHMIRGAAQHMAYHTGQIALLKKLVQSTPA
jgi:hypothetical protein